MSGKIIIAGATGYTGAALARSFAKDNTQCHLVSRNEEELSKLASETGHKYSVCSDVTNLQSVEESLKDVENISTQLYAQEHDYDVIDSKDNNVFNIRKLLP